MKTKISAILKSRTFSKVLAFDSYTDVMIFPLYGVTKKADVRELIESKEVETLQQLLYMNLCNKSHFR